jgi:hypothetical protein
MTQRSIVTGPTPSVLVRVGGDVTVEGRESDRVLAETDSRWGLKVERRSRSELARVRARVSNTVLLDLRVDPVRRKKGMIPDEVTEVQIGGSGKVYVPFGSVVEVYGGKRIELREVQGPVALFAGGDVRVRGAHLVVQLSAGGAIDLECEDVVGTDLTFSAGRDLRCYIRNLSDASILVDDLGGDWEGLIGAGRIKLQLKAGGDVTLVTPHDVAGQPPLYKLGRIEKPEQAKEN